jgi:hypothetical protein
MTEPGRTGNKKLQTAKKNAPGLSRGRLQCPYSARSMPKRAPLTVAAATIHRCLKSNLTPELALKQ